MDGKTLNAEKLEARIRELTPDNFTEDVHEIIEHCIKEGISQSDQNYVLNYIMHV